MSRIGTLPVKLASGVEVKIDNGLVRVKGPRGNLEESLAKHTAIELNDGLASVKRANDTKEARAMHGLMRSLLFNMVQGVTEGFSRTLEIVGVGYRAEVSGKKLTINVGYSHPVVMDVPEGLAVSSESPTRLTVSGTSKQKVGQFAAEIRKKRPPEPYKGKGIRYADEIVRRKVGKAGAAGGG
ncbi:MAG: 50S ribosomal protein L6 [bacterium]|nr:50S ribosomal protein L6 [bacterium]